MRRLLRLIRTFLHTCLCYYDIHDLPRGLRRLGPDELSLSRPAWIVRCGWCGLRFIAAAEPRFDAAAAMRHRPGRAAELRDVREVAAPPRLRVVRGGGKGVS